MDSYGKRQSSRGRGSRGGRQSGRGTPWPRLLTLSLSADVLVMYKLSYHDALQTSLMVPSHSLQLV